MSIDLSYDDTQQVLGDTLRQFCAEHCDDALLRSSAGEIHRDLWTALAELGVLAIGTPAGEGGALEMAATMEALGAAAFPGPLVATLLAGQVLTGDELAALIEGRLWVAAGSPPLLAFAPVAGLFLERRGDRVFRAEPIGEIEPIETLGGEAWGRVELKRVEEFAEGRRAAIFASTGLACYLAAAGARLVDVACEHARSRKQFGQAIGEFQAVAHPLADSSMALAAARTLARAAAFHFDRGDLSVAGPAASAARLSAGRAATNAVHVCHQVLGAIGITLEGPLFHVSRRIRQLASSEGEGEARAAVLQNFLAEAST